MSALDVGSRYLLDRSQGTAKEVKQRPRTIHVRLTADSLAKLLDRQRAEELFIHDVDKDEGSLQIGNECCPFTRTAEASPYPIYRLETSKRDAKHTLTWVGDVQTKISVRLDKSPSTSAFTKLKQSREEEAARKSEHRAVLLASAPSTTKSKTTALKLLPKGRLQGAKSQSRSSTPSIPVHEVVKAHVRDNDPPAEHLDSHKREQVKVAQVNSASGSSGQVRSSSATERQGRSEAITNGGMKRAESGDSVDVEKAEKVAAARQGNKNSTKDRLSKAAKGRGLPAKPIKAVAASAQKGTDTSTSKPTAGSARSETKAHNTASDRASTKHKTVSLEYTDSEEEGDTDAKKSTAVSVPYRHGVGRGALSVKEPWLDIRSVREWHELAKRFRRIYQDYQSGLDRVRREEGRLRKELELASKEVQDNRRNSIRTRSVSRNSGAHAIMDDDEREEGEADVSDYPQRTDDASATSFSWRSNGKGGHDPPAEPLSMDELDELVTTVCELEGQLRRMKDALQATSFA